MKRVRKHAKSLRPASQEMHFYDQENREDALGDSAPVFQPELPDRRLDGLIEAAIGTLTGRECLVFRPRFLEDEPMRYRELAIELGVSARSKPADGVRFAQTLLGIRLCLESSEIERKIADP